MMSLSLWFHVLPGGSGPRRGSGTRGHYYPHPRTTKAGGKYLLECFLGGHKSFFALDRGVCVTHSLRLTCSRAILFHVPASRHWWVSKPGSIVPPLIHNVRPLGSQFFIIGYEIRISIGILMG